MAVTLNTFTPGTKIESSKVNTNFSTVQDMMSQIGFVSAWLKTFSSQSSGTATTDTTDKLIDSSATFETDGVAVGMIIHNTTDDTFGIVSSIDSETQITIASDSQSGSSTTDVFPDGDENYVIYATPQLSDNWVECNGQTLSDSDSPYNGATIPNLNDTAGTQRFLRGSNTSGTTGGSDTNTHSHPNGTTSIDSWTNGIHDGLTTSENQTIDILPSYYEVVWVMRVK